jgi:hypothetical protein
MSRRPFTTFEVEKVAEYADPHGGTYCEPIHTDEEQEFADEEAVNTFWTVYGYRPHEGENGELLEDGGARAIFDGEENDVIDLAFALADGKPVFIRGNEVTNG